jgi:hypothetical protein
MPSRLAVAGFLVVVLLAAGCGNGDEKDEASAKKTTTTTAVAESTTTSSKVVSNTPNATGTGKGATASGPASAAGGATTSTTAAKANTSKSGVRLAAPGSYTYDRTGTMHSSVFGDQSLDGPITLKIDPPANNGTEQHAATTAPEGSNEQTIRLLDEGAYFTQLKQTRSGISKEFLPNPAVLALPNEATPGRTWSWTVTSTDGGTTLNASFKVERTETLTIGGRRIDTTVLTVVLKTTGDIEATITSTNWVSLAKSLIVRADDKSDGRVGSITFNSQSTQTLRSTDPS